MNYVTYIIYSHSTDKFYYGYTSDLIRRIEEHNTGITKSTKFGIPWKVVYKKHFVNKVEAIQLEKKLKKAKNKKYIKWFIENSE